VTLSGLEIRDAKGQFLWSIFVITFIPFDLKRPNLVMVTHIGEACFYRETVIPLSYGAGPSVHQIFESPHAFHGMKNSNPKFCMVIKKVERKILQGRPRPALAKIVTLMLTRDLFAVANLLVRKIVPVYYRATLCVSAVFAVARCPSVRPSVTLVYCIHNVEDVVKLLSLPGNPITLVF